MDEGTQKKDSLKSNSKPAKNTGWNQAKDLSQKLLQGYGLAILQLPFWIVAVFDLTPEKLDLISDNILYYFFGGFGVLGVDLFQKWQNSKDK